MNLTLVPPHFHLSFPYDEGMVLKAKSVPGAKWSKKLKVWIYPCTPRVYIALKAAFGVELPEVDMILEVKTIPSICPKTTPYQHQKEAMAFVLEQFGLQVKEV